MHTKHFLFLFSLFLYFQSFAQFDNYHRTRAKAKHSNQIVTAKKVKRKLSKKEKVHKKHLKTLREYYQTRDLKEIKRLKKLHKRNDPTKTLKYNSYPKVYKNAKLSSKRKGFSARGNYKTRKKSTRKNTYEFQTRKNAYEFNYNSKKKPTKNHKNIHKFSNKVNHKISKKRLKN